MNWKHSIIENWKDGCAVLTWPASCFESAIASLKCVTIRCRISVPKRPRTVRDWWCTNENNNLFSPSLSRCPSFCLSLAFNYGMINVFIVTLSASQVSANLVSSSLQRTTFISNWNERKTINENGVCWMSAAVEPPQTARKESRSVKNI